MFSPDLMYLMTHIRRVQPVSVDETYVYYQPMFLEGVPSEINETRLRFHEFGFGPAGFISPDDVEIMERNQIGIQAQGNDALSSGAASIGRRSWRTVALPNSQWTRTTAWHVDALCEVDA